MPCVLCGQAPETPIYATMAGPVCDGCWMLAENIELGYDLMYLPNRAHGFYRTDAYYTQRMWDYFVEHLLGQEPPDDFKLRLAEPPGG